MKKLGFIFIICLLFMGSALSQTITASRILKNMKEQFSQVSDYTADVEANVNLEKIRMPKVKIKVFFKQPDKFHYESKSFAMLPKGGINFNPMDYPEDKFTYKLNGKENINNVPVYALELSPKTVKKNEPEFKTYIWVDADRWVVKRIVNQKDELFKVIIDFNHSWIDGKYYMPTWIKISYDVKALPEGTETDKKPQRSRSPKFQKGDVSMNLQNYKINAGLSDDIFEQVNEKK